MVIFWLGMIIVVIIFLPDLSRLERGERLAFAGMWMLTGLYGTLFIADVYLPNITEVIIFILSTIYQWLEIT